MPGIEALFEKTVGEIETMLHSRTVVGEPIKIDNHTLIPLVNVGFGVGVGSGEGTEPNKGSGHGGGTGGGGGVKPVAVVIVDDDGVRVESIKSGTATVFERLAETVGKVAAGKQEDATA